MSERVGGRGKNLSGLSVFSALKVGQFIKLEDQSYRLVIESHLNHVLNGFGVSCHDDSLLLQKMMSHYRLRNTVYKYSYKKDFDFSQGMPAGNLRTMYDLLRFDNEIVLQQAVINGNIEKIILVKDDEEGDAILAHGFPKNANKILTKKCYEVGQKSGNGMAAFAMNVFNGPPRLAADNATYLNEQRRDLKLRESELGNLKTEYAELEKELRNLNSRFSIVMVLCV
jgi:chromosome segregation ATPase